LTVAFAGGSVFLIDADRSDFFFAVFLLVVLAFRGVFLRVALDMGVFFLFALGLPLAFLLVAIAASSTLTCMIVAEQKGKSTGMEIRSCPEECLLSRVKRTSLLRRLLLTQSGHRGYREKAPGCVPFLTRCPVAKC
jgi:hypothetical protein